MENGSSTHHETQFSHLNLSNLIHDYEKLIEFKIKIEALRSEELDLNPEICKIKDKFIRLMKENQNLKDSEEESSDRVTYSADWGNNTVSSEINEPSAKAIRQEIELLELILARCTIGLLDMQMMSEEIEVLKHYEPAAAKEMGVKVGKLEDGLWELKRMVVEIKGERKKDLMGLKKCGEEEGEDGFKVDWDGVLVFFGAVVVAAALFFLGNAKSKINPKSCES